MQATAVSRMVRIRGPRIPIMMDVTVKCSMALPRSDISRCPATRLAVNRTHRVTGRIRLLISSIITMKFIRGKGVPCGTRWISMWLVFFVHPNSMIVSQIVRDRGNVMGRCAVTEKFCGYRAVRFISKILMNIKIRIASVPLVDSPNA